MGKPKKQVADWRTDVIAQVRALMKQAAPKATEEVKWRKPSNPGGVPVWSHGGIICTGETYKNYVKLTFAKGASLPDPGKLFNAGLDGNVRRAIDFHEDDKLNDKELKALIRAAVALNLSADVSTRNPKKKKSIPLQRKSRSVSLTTDEFRELALNLPKVVEDEHMAHPDFRVNGKIFATLGYPDAGWGMVALNTEQQSLFVRTEPKVFRPVKGGWGKRGCTNVCLAEASEPSLRQALAAAWRNKAPKRLLKLLESE
jgi:hypothetical protein